MYVNPFWFGVLATVGAEILAIIVVAFIQYMKGDK
ncbi:hypothetical protein A8806_106249 [Faecalicatena orotica]|uniref:Uncharacterized protein n=1 Tax=Faecalicatena orotica TaxID=1544 RepID=A0A2Y9BHZ0_9FIRM|nr:hypothetical protein A8806_106249 [Faecalicatena orotica]SSA55965.1 hypothetical protein SAMN05216536_106249 [Faecalicatena orotica]